MAGRKSLTLYVIRHGEAERNVHGRWRKPRQGLSPGVALGYGLPNTGVRRPENGVETYFGE